MKILCKGQPKNGYIIYLEKLKPNSSLINDDYQLIDLGHNYKYTINTKYICHEIKKS